jgi:thymidine phosphorylase
MAPADRALYALRDVTATVPSVPLIASSVMSKKIAAGADAIVLDVKFGRGAFMPDLDSAVFLAGEMVQIGEGAGRRTVALVTAMDNPLGRAVGNLLEVREALAELAGDGGSELAEVSVAVAREMCALAGADRDPVEALRSGAGREALERMIAAQGGRLAETEGRRSAVVEALTAPASGWVASIDALEVGRACLDLGAGRQRKEDRVDPLAGIVIEAGVGDRVEAGQPLARLHTATPERAAAALGRLESAWTISAEPTARPAHILARVDRSGVRLRT